MKKILFMLLITVFIVGCSGVNDVEPKTPTKLDDSNLKKFNDFSEFSEFVKSKQSNNYGNFMVRAESMLMANSLSSDGAGASIKKDFSKTNTQYKNVDEADFVKTDGEYVYVLNDNKIFILNDEEIISNISFENNNYAQNFFIKNNKLIVFVNANKEGLYFDEYSIMPVPSYKQLTKIFIYDLNTINNPEIIESFEITGSYFSSRLIDNYVYVVSQDSNLINPPIIFAKERIMPEIYYFNDYEENYNLNTIISIDVNSNELVDYKTVLLGYSNTLMVSENNIYITYSNRKYCFNWINRCEENNRDVFIELVVPKLPSAIKDDVEDVLDKNLDSKEEYFIKEMDKDMPELENLVLDLEEYRIKKEMENGKTIIQKFEISSGKITHKATGSVYGNLLNQFSLDEFEDNLRVATTIDLWGRNRINFNNVYVLNKDLEIIGQIEKIAENESIYSTRFTGDKLYMVTFRQIDPFFVIDLEDPENPQVLGKLKIPGYSNYLHPISENIILGIGKETGENEWGGVSTKGVKLSLFDVSDFNNPQEIKKVEIGISGSDSAVLYDHKAFLYDEKKDLIIIPVSEVKSKEKYKEYSQIYKTWNGAYVFNSKLDTIAKIKHDEYTNTYFMWNDIATVQRSLYIENKLFTISNKFVKINDINNDFEELNSIEFPKIEYNRGIMY